MTIFVTTDTIGRVLAVYSTDVHSTAQIPSEAVEISAEHYAQWLGDQSLALVDGAMVSPTMPLDEAKAAKVAALRGACAAAIDGGFESPALGEVHHYPSGMIDQLNRSAAAAGGGGDLWCENDATWSLVFHTAEQARSVVADFSAARSAASRRLATLTTAIATATTTTDLDAITWEG